MLAKKKLICVYMYGKKLNKKLNSLKRFGNIKGLHIIFNSIA